MEDRTNNLKPTANTLKYNLLMLFAVFFTCAAYGQPTPQDDTEEKEHITGSKPGSYWFHSDRPNVHEFTVWGGYAFDSFRLWGKTSDSTLGQFGIGYNRKLWKLGNQILEYRCEINLYARYTYPEFEVERERNSLSGFGVMPAGFRINFLQNHLIQPFLGSSGGLMLLNDPFPDDRGKKLNFTFGASSGLEILLSATSSISLGYRYFHLSNGESGEINPGIDSSFFFASITVF